MFEFSRCVAIYTFVQFSAILVLTLYTVEYNKTWGEMTLVYFIIIVFTKVQNYAFMFVVFFESIFRHDFYAHCLILVDKITDSTIRIWSLCIMIGQFNSEGKIMPMAFILSSVYLFEF